jgi:hypothetical protein
MLARPRLPALGDHLDQVHVFYVNERAKPRTQDVRVPTPRGPMQTDEDHTCSIHPCRRHLHACSSAAARRPGVEQPFLHKVPGSEEGVEVLTRHAVAMAANFLASNLPANFGEAADGLRCVRAQTRRAPRTSECGSRASVRALASVAVSGGVRCEVGASCQSS